MDDVPSLQSVCQHDCSGEAQLFQALCSRQLFRHCGKMPGNTVSERSDAFCLMAAEATAYGRLVPCFWAYSEWVLYDHQLGDLPLLTKLQFP